MIGRKDEHLEKILKDIGQERISMLDSHDKKVIAQEAFKNLYVRSPISGSVNYITKDSNASNLTRI